MSLLADDRAQSIQVGAVLLFAVLIIAFSTYQAVIVPNENRRVEFEHNQEVQSQLSELRDAISATQNGGATRSTTVDLGTQYPSRAIGLNPSPPSGTLRTVGTTNPLANLTIRNATATGETGDFWNGERRHYNTGAIAYTPRYHQYAEAPETAYEHTVLANDFGDETLVVANQSFIDGTDVSFTTLNGSLERTSSASTAVDARPISPAQRTVQVKKAGERSPVTLNFTSRMTADRWRAIISGQHKVYGNASAAGEAYTAITVKLNASRTYDLRLTKAAVGTGATDEDPAYLTDVAGNESSVARGINQELTVEVRDAYNNPVAGVSLNASAATGGSLANDSATTDADGQATFRYRSSGAPPGTNLVNVTMHDDVAPASGDFNGDAAGNVSLVVDVTTAEGGSTGGEYDLNWTNPDDETANEHAGLSDCDGDDCTWDVGASDGDTLLLNTTLFPAFEGIDVEFAVDDQNVATVSPTASDTGPHGAAQTTLTAQDNGTVSVLASGNDDSDGIEIQVENVSGSGGGGTAAESVRYVDGSGSAARAGSESRVDFDIEHTGGQDATITDIEIDSPAGSLVSIYESNGGTGPGQREVYVDAADPGYFEAGDAGMGYTLGTTASLMADATLTSGEQAQVTLLAFRNNGGQTQSAADSDITVTLTFADGSAESFTFTPPGY